MQTFLPYPNFSATAKVLDYKRLGKERIEAIQILNTLTGSSNGWINHPAVKMWRGYEPALLMYLFDIMDEWKIRGYRNDACEVHYERLKRIIPEKSVKPHWLGSKEFHASHRSNLLRKDPIYYGQFGWKEPNNLEYVWPV
jgi:hypothetical protein